MLLGDNLPVCEPLPKTESIVEAWPNRRAAAHMVDLPELGTDLVTTLTGLQMNNLSH
jgi:hypothetical protein